MMPGIEAQWFGDHSEVVIRRTEAVKVAAVAARVVTAKPFPGIAERVRVLASAPSTSAVQVARVLEGDAALCARLLRLVNSAGYGLRVKCSSVRHAVVLAGLDNVRELVTSATVLNLFDGESRQLAEMLRHCAQVGAVCRYLGAFFSLPKEMLFTCGFMHDIGKLMMLEVHGEKYRPLLAEPDPGRIHAAEQEAFGYDHASLGAAVLERWKIPSPVPTVVEHHHDFAAAARKGGELAQLVAVVRLADDIVHAIGSGDTAPEEGMTESPAADYLGISGAQLSAMWLDLLTLVRKTEDLVENKDTSWLDRVSVRPKLRANAGSAETEMEALEEPVTYPCYICGVASYGEVCPGCSGHVCPEHGGAREGLCVACADRFAELQRLTRRRMPLYAGLSMAVASAAMAVSLLWSGWPPATEQLMAHGVFVLLVGTVTAALYQYLARRRFVKESQSGAREVDDTPVVNVDVELMSELSQIPR